MIKRCGFTLIELIITIGMVAFLTISIVMVYLSCFRAFNAGNDRSKIRTQLSQAMEKISRDVYKTKSITVCNATTLTITAGSYSLSNNNLIGPTGAIKATGIQPQSTVVSWGTTPALFVCSNGEVTIDMTAVNNSGTKNSETVHMKTQVRPRNMPVGLVGWWSMNEGSGTSTTADSSGNGYGGTLIASPTWTTDHLSVANKALSFNGTTQYVTTTNLDLNILTFAGWIKRGDKAATCGIATCDRLIGCNGSNGWAVYFQGNTSDKIEFGKVGVWERGSTATITDTAWHHIAVTYNGTTIYFYIDGLLDSTSTYADTFNSSSVTYSIGTIINGYTQFFNGSMDELRVYNRVLSPTEIWHIYRGDS